MRPRSSRPPTPPRRLRPAAHDRTRGLLVGVLSLLLALGGCGWARQTIGRCWAEPGPPDVPVGVRTIRDRVYRETPEGPLRLDVYRPQHTDGRPLPVLVFVFGGGWMMGNKNQVGRMGAQRLARRGYVVVSPDYRLSSRAIFPAQIRDVKAAIRWIRVHAGPEGFDPDRIAIWGPSAGGHLAALAGTTGNVASLDPPAPAGARSVPTHVQAVVDFYGPTDLSQADAHRLEGGVVYDERGSFARRFVGGPLALHRDRVQMANPIAYVTPDDPPFLIVHGDEDEVVPPHQSELLAAALRAAGVPVTLRIVEGGRHGRGGAFGSDLLFEEVVAFLDRHLRPDAADGARDGDR